MTETSKRRPAQPRANLSQKISNRLRGMVHSGELAPGDQLPTELELTRTHGVSRTVIREAIAALRSEGLVIARQGSGVFVAQSNSMGSRLAKINFEPEKLSSIIEVLELRAAVESEAAALAAERRSPAELARIRECHRAVAKAMENGEPGEMEDFTLHLAIAESTHNKHFVEFFRFLGGRTIPRAQLSNDCEAAIGQRTYWALIQTEHERIVMAICEQDATGAHEAMRDHLKGSQARYEQVTFGD